MVRELMFRRNQVLSVLSERRSAFRPYGLQGKIGSLYDNFSCAFGSIEQ